MSSKGVVLCVIHHCPACDCEMRHYTEAVTRAVDAVAAARALGIRQGRRGECARECQAYAEAWERTALWEAREQLALVTQTAPRRGKRATVEDARAARVAMRGGRNA